MVLFSEKVPPGALPPRIAQDIWDDFLSVKVERDPSRIRGLVI